MKTDVELQIGPETAVLFGIKHEAPLWKKSYGVTGDFKSDFKTKKELEHISTIRGKAMGKYPKGAMGLTTDAAKQSSEYKADRARFDRSMADLRKFNSVFIKIHKKEYMAHMKAKRASK